MPKASIVIEQKPAPRLNWFKIIGLSLLLAVLFAVIGLFLTTGAVALIVWSKIQPELQNRNLDLPAAAAAVRDGWNQPIASDNGHFNFLILGLDTLANRGDVPPLTDTMMVASFNSQTQQVSMFSLPRDLWLDEPRTKINALYAYGLDQNPLQPTELVTSTISKTINLTIHRTILITLDQLEHLIDLVGGVQITVPEGFTDPLFPRTDVDIKKSHTTAELYESITFVSGQQTMSGAMALKYIRSRHSKGAAGTDVARGQRQQLVIESLISQLARIELYRKKPTLLLDLWQWYNQNFAGMVSLSEATSLARPIIEAGKVPELKPVALPIMVKDKFTGKTLEPGVFYNPPVAKNKYLGQWVYVIPDLAEFQSTVKKALY
jgi:LCP family protein required for cell wall assembly